MGCADEVWRTMQEAEFTSKYAGNIYLTVYDAVQTAENALCTEHPVSEMVARPSLTAFIPHCQTVHRAPSCRFLLSLSWLLFVWPQVVTSYPLSVCTFRLAPSCHFLPSVCVYFSFGPKLSLLTLCVYFSFGPKLSLLTLSLCVLFVWP